MNFRKIYLSMVVFIVLPALCRSADPRTDLSKIRGLILNVDSEIESVANEKIEEELFWAFRNALPELRIYKSSEDRNFYAGENEVYAFNITLKKAVSYRADFTSVLSDDIVIVYYYSISVGALYQDSYIGVFFKDYWHVLDCSSAKQRDLQDSIIKCMDKEVNKFTTDWKESRKNK